MASFRIPSPARSQGTFSNPRLCKPRRSRSVGTPTKSENLRLTAIISNSFVASPLPTRKSILTDNTQIEAPTRKSWWKRLNENSRDVMAVLQSKTNPGIGNVGEEYMDVEILSQEKKNFTMDLPESSDGESICSIVIPQRKLFHQKDIHHQNKYDQLISNQEGSSKQQKSTIDYEQELDVAPKNLFNRKPRTKPIFPSALLNISANKTVDKTREVPIVEDTGKTRNLFGNRLATKRKNMFADFIVSDSEDEIPEIQAKIFGFNKNNTPKRRESTASQRQHSPTSSITDIDIDEWKLLPSSTMVGNQLEIAATTPYKRAKLNKLLEFKELATVSQTDIPSKKKSISNSSKNTTKTLSTSKTKELEPELLITSTTEGDENKTNKSKSINKSQKERTFNKKTQVSVSENLAVLENKQNNTEEMVSKDSEINLDLPIIKSDFVQKESCLQVNQINHDNVLEINKESTIFAKSYSDDSDSEGVNKLYQNKSVVIQNVVLEDDHDDNFTLQYENDEEVLDSEINKCSALPVIRNDKTNEVSFKHSITSQKFTESTNHVVGKNNTSFKITERGSELADPMDEYESNTDIVTDKCENGNIENVTTKNIERDKTVNEEKQDSKYYGNEKEIHTCDGKLRDEDVNKPDHVLIDLKSITNSIEVAKNISSVGESDQNKLKVVGIESMQNETLKDMLENNKCEQEEKIKTNENVIENDKEELQVEKTLEKETENEDHDRNEQENDNKGKNDSENVQEHETGQNFQLQIEEKIENEHNSNIEEESKENESRQHIEQEIQNKQNEDGNTEEDLQIKKRIEDKETENEDYERNEKENQNNEINDNDNEEEHDTDQKFESENEEDEEHDTDQIIESEIEEEEENENDNNSETEEEEADCETEEENESNRHIEEESQIEQIEEDESDLLMEEDENLQDGGKGETEDAEIESDFENENGEELLEKSDQPTDNEHDGNIVSDTIETDDDDDDDNVDKMQSENDDIRNSDNDDQANESDQQEYVTEDENDNNKEIDDERQASYNELNDHDPNLTHASQNKDVTIKSPETILHDRTNRVESTRIERRDSEIRKTKSMIQPLNVRPSLAPVRESAGFSDGTKDSSAEGSGWDSHRTTRKTLRQTFGKDFTPRKSLRALVMEKSAKRQTDVHQYFKNNRPQSNSTEIPNQDTFNEPVFIDESPDISEKSVHDVSLRTRKANLDMCLQNIRDENMQFRKKMEEEVKNMLNGPPKNPFTIFKGHNKRRVLKPIQSKAKPQQVKCPNLPFVIPTEMLEDMKYKPPKRFKPSNAAWVSKRLYNFLEHKLKPKYDYKARVRAEKFVQSLYEFTKHIRRHEVAPTDAVDVLKHEMARLEIVKTHHEFYTFFWEYMPQEIRVKVIPDIVNKIPLPRHGVFTEILG